MKLSTPTFSRPMELIIPEGVGNRRGGSLPEIGCAEVPFTTTPPILFRSTNGANSSPYPNVPLAARMGLRRRIPAISTERSGGWLIWANQNLAYNLGGHDHEGELSIDDRRSVAIRTGPDGGPDSGRQCGTRSGIAGHSTARSPDGPPDG